MCCSSASACPSSVVRPNIIIIHAFIMRAHSVVVLNESRQDLITKTKQDRPVVTMKFIMKLSPLILLLHSDDKILPQMLPWGGAIIPFCTPLIAF